MSGSGLEKSASSFGLTKAITMDYKHEEETVLMQYGGGDPCPPGTSAATLSVTRVKRLRIVLFAQVVSNFQPGTVLSHQPCQTETPVRKRKR